MDLFTTNNEHVESSAAEDNGISIISTQSPGAQIVNGQHVNISASSLHVNGPQAVTTQNPSTVACVFHSTMHPNATSPSHLVQTANASYAAASQIATPQANTITLASAQGGSSIASNISSSLPIVNLTTGVGVQSANAHHTMSPGPMNDPSGSAMNGISYGGHTANMQSHISQTAPSANRGNFSTGLHQTSQTMDTSPPNVSDVGCSAHFSDSGNAVANAIAQNLPAVAGSTFLITPNNLRASNQGGTSLAAADHLTSTLTAAYQTYHQTYLASNQSRAAVQVNPNHGIQANTTINPNIHPVSGLIHAVNPGQATIPQGQAAALRALVAQVSQARTMSPRARTPLHHAQGPFVDGNDPVSVEISQRMTNLRAMTEHRHKAHAADINYRGTLIRQNSLFASPLQAQPTNQAINSQAANQGPTSSNGTLQPANNAFDTMLQVIGDQDNQLALAGLDNRGNPIPPRPAQPYTENDSLQAYLIRQQLVAGIPPEEVVPMNSFSTQRQLLHGGPIRTCDPALIRVQRSTGAMTVPHIPRARFSGRIDPLPFDMQSLNLALSRNAQTTPSDGSLLQFGEGNESNQGTFESGQSFPSMSSSDDTQQTTDDDVVMNNSDGTPAEQ